MRRNAERIFDEYLAASARAGDRCAIERLAKRWSPKLFRHACRLTGDAEMARDASQEAWADIIRGLPRLHDSALFPSWAFRIVSRRCYDEIRKARRGRKTNAAFAAEPVSEDRSAASMEASADRPRLLLAIEGLPNDQRAAIALFHLEDLSVAEISAALAVPAGTVKTRLMHARRKLRAALSDFSEGGKFDD